MHMKMKSVFESIEACAQVVRYFLNLIPVAVEKRKKVSPHFQQNLITSLTTENFKSWPI